MYCPNCGHRPSSAAPRFCSGCGLRLDQILRLMEAGGVLDDSAAPAAGGQLSPRRQGVRFGAKLMFASAVLLPPTLLLSFAAESPAPLFLSLTVFFLGLCWALYARLFRDEAPAPRLQEKAPLPLSAPPPEPLGFADRLQPPSVVDPATKPLGRQ